MTDPDSPDHLAHLKPIEPAHVVADLCDKILALHGIPHHVRLEAEAFRETCTPHDGRRLVKALREAFDVLACEVEKILPTEAAIEREPVDR
jgi:hypothetical protein